MAQHSDIFIGLDTSKLKISWQLPTANGMVRCAVRGYPVGLWVSEVDGRQAGHSGGARLHFCYEAGPTGYDLHRQIIAKGHDCVVVAPSLIPKHPGDRVKTNRRDDVSLARVHCAGELTSLGPGGRA